MSISDWFRLFFVAGRFSACFEFRDDPDEVEKCLFMNVSASVEFDVANIDKVISRDMVPIRVFLDNVC